MCIIPIHPAHHSQRKVLTCNLNVCTRVICGTECGFGFTYFYFIINVYKLNIPFSLLVSVDLLGLFQTSCLVHLYPHIHQETCSIHLPHVCAVNFGSFLVTFFFFLVVKSNN